MRFLLPALVLTLSNLSAAQDPTDLAARIDALLRRTPLVDGHNDIIRYYVEDPNVAPSSNRHDLAGPTPRRQSSLPLWREGRLGAQLFNGGWRHDDTSLAGTRRGRELLGQLIERHSDSLAFARNADDVRRAHGARRVALLWALEHPLRLGNSPETIRELAELGLRAAVIAYNQASPLADGAYGPPLHGGLSPLGRTQIAAMQQHGILVDLSHASTAAAHAVLDLARAPVIFSHSSAAALCPDGRNVPDDILRRLPANGGIVMVSFVPYFTRSDFLAWMRAGDDFWEKLRREYPADPAAVKARMAQWETDHPAPVVQLTDVADHIEHIRRIAGVDHVGLGSDFEGMDFTIQGLENSAKVPDLLVELARRGWTDDDLAKLAGENFLRVLSAAASP